MLTTPKAEAWESLARLASDRDFQVVLGWLQDSLDTLSLQLYQEGGKHVAGQCNVLSEIVLSVEKAPVVVESIRSASSRQSKGHPDF